MNAEKHSAAVVGSNPLCVIRDSCPSFQSTSAAWMCVDKQTISHSQMHGNAWQMWVILPPCNKYQNNISVTLPYYQQNTGI